MTSIRPAKHQVCVASDTYEYGANRMYGDRHAIRRAHVLRATSSHTVWPGDFVELELPAEFAKVTRSSLLSRMRTVHTGLLLHCL